MAAHTPITFSTIDVDEPLRDHEAMRTWLKEICAQHDSFIGRLHYHFCSDAHLLEMNKQHLSHDYYTDVITFDASRPPLISGDVFISLDRVRDNADTLDTGHEVELWRVMAHGLLHLLGYGDKTAQEQEIMRGKENWALRLLH